MSANIRTGGGQGFQRVGLGCATLFALPFLLGGITMIAAGLAGGQAQGGPDEAPPWVLLPVGMLFGAVGVGVPIGAWTLMRKARERQQLEQENPGQPWRWRADWASGRIRCRSGAETLFLWIFAVFWNAVSWSVLAIGFEALGEEGPIAFVVLLFPLIGLGLLAWAIVSTLRRRKYGSSELTLSTIPGVVGGRLSGRLETTFKGPPAKGARLRLDCAHTTGSGKSSTTRTIWSSEEHVPAARMSLGWQGVSIPVEFGIPSSCLPTSESRAGAPDARISWQLYASADTPGLDYEAQFDVPIFRTEASREDVGEVEARTLGRANASALAFDPATASFLERSGPRGEQELHFPANKRRAEARALAAFTLLWLGVAAAIFHFDGPLWFSLPWTGIGLLMLYGVLHLAFGSSTIRVSDGQLEVESRLLGYRRARSVAVREVVEVRPVAGGAQQGSSTQAPSMWWEVKARRAEDPKTAGSTWPESRRRWARPRRSPPGFAARAEFAERRLRGPGAVLSYERPPRH